MALLIFYVVLALGVSFLCSIMEAVLLSVTPSYVAVKEREGHPLGKKLRGMKEDIERPLAAILSLNTIAHTVGATGAGAQAIVVFGDAFVGIISGVLTLLILVVSEIIPKTIGALYWRQLTPLVVRFLAPTIWLLWPLVKLSQGITHLLSRDTKEASVSREEMTALAEIGQQEGVFEENESLMLKNLFHFNSVRVRDVMTPRTVVFMLPETTTVGEVIEMHEPLRFSRIPIYQENRDNLTGYILKDEMLLKAAQSHTDVTLQSFKREPLFVPDTLPLPELLERMLKTSEHIALVVGEYGGMAGVVSLEDVVETLLGTEIVDEADSVDDMQTLARQQWLQRAQRFGIISEDFEHPGEKDAAIRLGLTGQGPKDL